MTVILAQRASKSVYELAECPTWNPDAGRILWVDIPAGRLHSGTISHSGIVDTDVVDFGVPITSVSLARDGGMLVTGERALMTIDSAGTVRRSADIVAPSRGSRMNDGACDAAGRLLVGTLAVDGEKNEQLLQVSTNGTVSVMRNRLGLSNGIAWSPDDRTLYHVDSTARIVWAADYEVATGTANSWRAAFTVDGGLPDGIAVDIEGMLWVAVWGAGQVRRYDVAGTVLSVVNVAAPHTSSVAFAGPKLDRLVITSARSELTPSALARNPDSGALFLADPGVSGVPVGRWGGNTIDPPWTKIRTDAPELFEGPSGTPGERQTLA